jgi:hypothetical protein
MMKTVKVTSEYGIVIRRASLAEKNIDYSRVLQAMEVVQPFDSNDDILSFGPSFGEEAMNGFISRLQALGLEYVDDFFNITYDLPSWCGLRMEINGL